MNKYERKINLIIRQLRTLWELFPEKTLGGIIAMITSENLSTLSNDNLLNLLKEKMNTSYYHSSAITNETETADGKEVNAMVALLK